MLRGIRGHIGSREWTEGFIFPRAAPGKLRRASGGDFALQAHWRPIRMFLLAAGGRGCHQYLLCILEGRELCRKR